MAKYIILTFFVCSTLFFSALSNAEYALGCQDPKYHEYIAGQFDEFEARNRRLLNSTLRDYEVSLNSSDNLFQIIGHLSRHLKYSAQFEPYNTVERKIDWIFEHANQLSVEQQIAGDVFDSFSTETHHVGLARAWLSYRQGNLEMAFDQLLQSIEVADSLIMSSFGPDLELVRQLYNDGHVEPVIAYIKKTEQFWKGSRPDELRRVWLKMIDANCKVQFDFVDTLKAKELGINLIDLERFNQASSRDAN